MIDPKKLTEGTRVYIHYPDGERAEGVVIEPPTRHEVLTSRGVEMTTSAGIQWDDGDYTGERPEDLEGIVRADGS